MEKGGQQRQILFRKPNRVKLSQKLKTCVVPREAADVINRHWQLMLGLDSRPHSQEPAAKRKEEEKNRELHQLIEEKLLRNSTQSYIYHILVGKMQFEGGYHLSSCTIVCRGFNRGNDDDDDDGRPKE
jgi:hypothetical protein